MGKSVSPCSEAAGAVPMRRFAAVVMVAVGSGIYCSPRHRMPLTQVETGVQHSLDDEAPPAPKGLADIARHVIGCHLPHIYLDKRVIEMRVDDVAGNMCLSLRRGARCGGRSRASPTQFGWASKRGSGFA
jgi:hypothetical protein